MFDKKNNGSCFERGDTAYIHPQLELFNKKEWPHITEPMQQMAGNKIIIEYVHKGEQPVYSINGYKWLHKWLVSPEEMREWITADSAINLTESEIQNML